ncbi:MAG: hypothetical protein KBO59_27560 [Achromobacter sp.]|nr:hypothetical protein [Achromobacter sp.]
MTACAESVPLEAGVARRRLAWPWLLMALALPASMLAALCVGRYPLPLAHVSSVLAGLALPDGLADWLPAVSGAEQRVVLQVRPAPRDETGPRPESAAGATAAGTPA